MWSIAFGTARCPRLSQNEAAHRRAELALIAGDGITTTVGIAAGRCDADCEADLLVSASERIVGTERLWSSVISGCRQPPRWWAPGWGPIGARSRKRWPPLTSRFVNLTVRGRVGRSLCRATVESACCGQAAARPREAAEQRATPRNSGQGKGRSQAIYAKMRTATKGSCSAFWTLRPRVQVPPSRQGKMQVREGKAGPRKVARPPTDHKRTTFVALAGVGGPGSSWTPMAPAA